MEGTPATMLVLTVTATDVDTPSDRISYSLDQLDDTYFTIGTKTGELRTSQIPLDREKTPVLYFDVKASDGEKRTGVTGIKVRLSPSRSKFKMFILASNAPEDDGVKLSHGKRKRKTEKED